MHIGGNWGERGIEDLALSKCTTRKISPLK